MLSRILGVLDYSVRAHKRFAHVMCGSVIGIVLISLILNICSIDWFNLKFINIFLLLIVDSVILYAMTRPDMLTFVSSAGFISQMGFTSAKDALKKWYALMFQVMLYISLYLLAATFLNFRENFSGVFVGFALFTVIFLMDMHWEITAPFAKYIVYLSIMLMLTFVGIGFIPSSTWISVTGHDYGAFVRIDKTQEAVSKAYAQMERNKAIASEKEANEILKQINNGYTPSAADLKFLEEHNNPKTKSIGETWKSLSSGMPFPSFGDGGQWKEAYTFSANAEVWFPDRIFQPGDKLKIHILYNTVALRSFDGTLVNYTPGYHDLIMTTQGSPSFKSLGNRKAKVTVIKET